jgi:hypothetical protein
VKGVRAIAAVLVAVGCALIFTLVGPKSWPLVLGWLAASLLVGLLWGRLAHSFRLALAIGLLPVCVLLTWEGGLFLLPSVIALTVASIPGRRSVTA